VARRDLYAILGVSRSAGQDDIKKAYRNLARRYHPDRNADDEEAADRFREIAEAYETLSQPELRARYDRLGPLYRPDGRPPSPDEVTDWVTDTIGGMFRKRKPDQGEDLRYTLSIALEDVATGGDRNIEVKRQCHCASCAGSGAAKNGRQPCAHCEGTGRAGGRRLFRTQCPHCNGEGQVTVKKCEICSGSGRTEHTESLKVRIPKGVSTGQKLKLRAKGNDAKVRGETGDLYVIINVTEHDLFQRRGSDLFCTVPVRLSDMALGTALDVPTITGKATIKVAPGSESGKVLRLAGRGLPTMKGNRTGDLHITLDVETPSTLSDKQRAALEQLNKALDSSAYPKRAAFIANMDNRS
jgi:molecular chaperone DnaJ